MSILKFVAVAGMAAHFAAEAQAEAFVDVGIGSNRIESDIANRPDTIERTDAGMHVGLGARRMMTDRIDLGVRLELDDAGSDTFMAVRAFDFRYHVSEKFAAAAFFGAARLELATPAYGYYLGAGIQWKEIVTHWDLNFDVRFGDKVARDNLLPSDPQGGRPDNFHNVTSLSVYMSYRF